MRFKLDENLGLAAAALFKQAGHDVATVPAQGLSGSADRRLIDVCKTEGMCLVTLDAEFANPLVFPPNEYRGIVVLRLHGRGLKTELFAALETLLQALSEPQRGEADGPDGRLWIVQPGKLRIYQAEERPGAEDEYDQLP